MNRTNKQEILQRYREGRCSESELKQLEDWYNDWHIQDRILLSEPDLEQAEHLMRLDVMRRVGFASQNTFQENQPMTPVKRLWPRLAIVAAAVAAITVGVWLYNSSKYSIFNDPESIRYATDVAPGKNTATLTLPNGEKVELSDAKTGVVIDATKIKYDDETTVPNGAGLTTGASSAQKDLSVTTPRGGQYQVILSDGTKVLLNAASSIRFPASFAGAKQRRVEISGEVYLEVRKDENHPFIVKSSAQEIEVLGTHFNINDYADERSAMTTLLEGSVSVSALQKETASSQSSDRKVLKPGQQSIIEADKIQIRAVNIKEITAWKDGDFRFEDQSITDIMKQISRWYNVDVVYEDDVSDIRLNASISRNRNVSQVLKMMEKTGEVYFKVEGRKIIVNR